MRKLKRGGLVRFRIRDVFYPGAIEALRQVTEDAQLCGRLLFFSDAGRQRAQYAVIDVQGMGAPVIVSVERLHGIPPAREEAVRQEVTAVLPSEER